MSINSNNDKPYSVAHIANMGFDKENQLPMVESVTLDNNGGIQRPIANITQQIDEADANTTYIGYAQQGTLTSAALWRIKRLLTSSTVTAIEWADGNISFDNVWDNRASLSYS